MNKLLRGDLIIVRLIFVCVNTIWGFAVISLIQQSNDNSLFLSYIKYQAIIYGVLTPLDIFYKSQTITDSTSGRYWAYIYILIVTIILSIDSFINSSFLAIILFLSILGQNIFSFQFYYHRLSKRLQEFEIIKGAFLLIGIIQGKYLLVLIGPIIGSIFYVIKNQKEIKDFNILFSSKKNKSFDNKITRSITISSILGYLGGYLDQLLLLNLRTSIADVDNYIIAMKFIKNFKVIARKTVELLNDKILKSKDLSMIVGFILLTLLGAINIFNHYGILRRINLEINDWLFFNTAALLITLNLTLFSLRIFRISISKKVKTLYLHDIFQILVFIITITIFPLLKIYSFYILYIGSAIMSTIYLKVTNSNYQ